MLLPAAAEAACHMPCQLSHCLLSTSRLSQALALGAAAAAAQQGPARPGKAALGEHAPPPGPGSRVSWLAGWARSAEYE
jgi:hypothetical protein